MTIDGHTTGTPAFLPPELALGEEEIDGRADIYGLCK
jgi:serine/threonine-protein kinase